MLEQQSSRAPFAGHPAYDESTRDHVCTPRPGPRVKPEAQEFAARNRGSLNLSWESSDLSSRLNSDNSAGRYCSNDGRENLLRSRGSLANVLYSQASGKTPRASVPCRSVTSQGEGIAEQSKGGRMNLLFTSYASGKTPRASVPCRSVTSQGEGIAEQSKGGRMNMLFTNYGKNETTPRGPPRVKTEAADNYQLNRGIAMNNILHNPKTMPMTARSGPRVKPEAEDNAMKNRGSMNSIMRACTPRY